MSLKDEIWTSYAIILQPTARAKDSQKPLKDPLAMYQKQDLGLGIASTFLIN